jgi:phosphoribosylamine--glycine ligase
MRVLVIGNGAREHALCWKLRQSPLLTELYCAPGNPGIAAVADRVPIAPEEVPRLADFATEMRIDLTVVGPELPLTLGVADEFAGRGLAIFGPTQRAAEIEGSKVFSKLFMDRHKIPTAPFAVVHDAAAALAEARRFGLPVVLKADGLAAGKGVLIAGTEEELAEAARTLFEERRFGASGDRVVVEACRGTRCRSWPSATASGCSPSPPPATTSGSATATPAPTPGEWEPTAPRAGSRPRPPPRWWRR